MAKIFIILGFVFLTVGLCLSFFPHFSLFRFIRLPGDILVKRGNFTFYFPLATSIILSILLTLVLSFFSRR